MKVKLINISSPHIVTIFFCVMRAPKIYSLSKFPVFNTVFLTIVIILYIRFLDLFILHDSNLVSFDQYIPIFPISAPLVTIVLLSASTYFTSLDST